MPPAWHKPEFFIPFLISPHLHHHSSPSLLPSLPHFFYIPPLLHILPAPPPPQKKPLYPLPNQAPRSPHKSALVLNKRSTRSPPSSTHDMTPHITKMANCKNAEWLHCISYVAIYRTAILLWLSSFFTSHMFKVQAAE